LIALPDAASPRGTLYVTIPVDGFFRDSGQRFHGSIDINVAIISGESPMTTSPDLTSHR
jgi:hypothetical protein